MGATPDPQSQGSWDAASRTNTYNVPCVRVSLETVQTQAKGNGGDEACTGPAGRQAEPRPQRMELFYSLAVTSLPPTSHQLDCHYNAVKGANDKGHAVKALSMAAGTTDPHSDKAMGSMPGSSNLQDTDSGIWSHRVYPATGRSGCPKSLCFKKDS